MKSLYLIDGSGYIFRAFYATPRLTNAAGLPTNGLYGFTRMLLSLLTKSRATYLAVVFDSGKKNFRHDLYADYKANRIECPEELKVQMPYFRKIVRSLGIACLEQDGFEADDLIATIADKTKTVFDEIVIVSSDKDFMQLVGGNVVVWDAMKEMRYGEDDVKNKFGISPQLVVDYLSLVGDSSDNVPGAKGVGPKTAVHLLNHFGSLQSVLSQTNEISLLKGLRGAAGVERQIDASRSAIELSKELVTLRKDVPLGFDMGDAELWSYQGVVKPEVGVLLRELGFNKLLEQLGCKVEEANNQDEIFDPLILDDKNLKLFLDQVGGAKKIVVEPLTTPAFGKLLLVTIKEETTWFIFIDDLKEDSVVQSSLREVLADSEVKKYGLNLKKCYFELTSWGLEICGLEFDVMIAAYLLRPDFRYYDLVSLIRENLPDLEQDIVQDSRQGEQLVQSDLWETPAPSEVPSASDRQRSFFNYRRRQRALFKLCLLMEERLVFSAKGDFGSLAWVMAQIEMPLVPVLAKMELSGIAVDEKILQALDSSLNQELAALTQEIQNLAGKSFNINSPKQLGAVLFEDLKIPTKGVKRTKTDYSTSADVLVKLVSLHPIIAKILEYREIHKLQTTYVQGLMRLIDKKTGRVHSTFNQTVAATGRLSSSEPNLQNIPIRTARGRQIRQAFVPAAGCVLLSADYSQIELRVLAHLSQDSGLISAFRSGQDIHELTAREVFAQEIQGKEVPADLRRAAKTINFGVIYGIGPNRLAEELGIGRAEAKEFIERYFDKYPGVKSYFASLSQQIAEVGYVKTWFGRLRQKADIDLSHRDPGYIERSLLNFPLQGTAADIIKLAMIELDSRLGNFRESARLVLQVHDELVVEVQSEVVDDVSKIVREAMIGVVEFSAPLEVDISVSNVWE